MNSVLNLMESAAAERQTLGDHHSDTHTADAVFDHGVGHHRASDGCSC